jgi:hypothetical protein
MATAANVLPIFAEPDGKASLTALSDAIRKTKFHERLTTGELAFELRCDPGTVKNAENGHNLLRFDIVARLLRKYPQHCAGVFQLWDPEPRVEPTIAQRLDTIERETAALKQEMRGIEADPKKLEGVTYPFREREEA